MLQVIIAGPTDAPETKALLTAAYAPDRVVIPIDLANKASTEWYKQHNPEALAMVEGASKEVCCSQVITTISYNNLVETHALSGMCDASQLFPKTPALNCRSTTEPLLTLLDQMPFLTTKHHVCVMCMHVVAALSKS